MPKSQQPLQPPQGPSCLSKRPASEAAQGSHAAAKTLMGLMRGREGGGAGRDTSLLIRGLTSLHPVEFRFSELPATNQRDQLPRPPHCSMGGREWSLPATPASGDASGGIQYTLGDRQRRLSSSHPIPRAGGPAEVPASTGAGFGMKRHGLREGWF